MGTWEYVAIAIAIAFIGFLAYKVGESKSKPKGGGGGGGKPPKGPTQPK